MAWTTPSTRATGDLITASIWNADIVANLKEVWYEADRVSLSANGTVTATSEATAGTIISSGALTFDGNADCEVIFNAPQVSVDSNRECAFLLYDGTAPVGVLTNMKNPDGSNTLNVPVRLSHILTPSSGSHTFRIRAYVSAGTATVLAGAGGAGTLLPGYLRVLKHDA